MTARIRKRPLAYHQQRQNWRKRLLKEYGSFCCFCFVPLSVENTTFDHVIPKSKGGGWNYWNLRPACQSCNAERADNDFTTFRISKYLELSQATMLLPPSDPEEEMATSPIEAYISEIT